MTRSRKRRHHACVKRPPAEYSDHTGRIMAIRFVLMVWEIVWTLVREHALRGTGPGPLL